MKEIEYCTIIIEPQKEWETDKMRFRFEATVKGSVRDIRGGGDTQREALNELIKNWNDERSGL